MWKEVIRVNGSAYINKTKNLSKINTNFSFIFLKTCLSSHIFFPLRMKEVFIFYKISKYFLRMPKRMDEMVKNNYKIIIK